MLKYGWSSMYHVMLLASHTMENRWNASLNLAPPGNEICPPLYWCTFQLLPQWAVP